jgi:hypothetical protein
MSEPFLLIGARDCEADLQDVTIWRLCRTINLCLWISIRLCGAPHVVESCGFSGASNARRACDPTVIIGVSVQGNSAVPNLARAGKSPPFNLASAEILQVPVAFLIGGLPLSWPEVHPPGMERRLRRLGFQAILIKRPSCAPTTLLPGFPGLSLNPCQPRCWTPPTQACRKIQCLH